MTYILVKFVNFVFLMMKYIQEIFFSLWYCPFIVIEILSINRECLMLQKQPLWAYYWLWNNILFWRMWNEHFYKKRTLIAGNLKFAKRTLSQNFRQLLSYQNWQDFSIAFLYMTSLNFLVTILVYVKKVKNTYPLMNSQV